MSTNNLRIVKCYTNYLDFISLDETFITSISQGKALTSTVYVPMDEDTYRELGSRKINLFDYNYYFDLLNNCEDDKAYNYMMKHDKSINPTSYDLNLFGTLEDAQEYLKDINK